MGSHREMRPHRDLEQIRSALDQLENAMREAEALRDDIDRARRTPPFWPERRAPQRWSKDSVVSHMDDLPPHKKR